MSLHPGSSPFLEVWLMGTKPYKPVEALHAQGKPWLRRAQPERMQGYLRQVTNQAIGSIFFAERDVAWRSPPITQGRLRSIPSVSSSASVNTRDRV